MGYIKADLKRCFTSIWFFIAVIGISLSYFLGDFGDLTMNISRFDVLSFMKISSSIGYFSELTILLAALPFTMSFCEDIENNYIRFLIIRGNSFKYALSKIIVCIVSSFISVFVGKACIILFLMTKLPLVSETTGNYEVFINQTFGYLLINKNFILYFIIEIFFTAVICSMFSIIGLTITTYINNKFLAITAPIISYFIFYQISRAMKLPTYLSVNRLMNGDFILGKPMTNIIYVTVIGILTYSLGLLIFYKGVVKNVKR
ncbi:ABC transporter permease [Clostridium sp. C8]|uniref:ABC-2 family transporter protein n=1 Tax=bioreactor metagenome TaxID=1076179 RepID=A0A645C4H6_9ZZZZ|nr:ABC transporter permease [Clostridium sp. C8]KLE16320.1 hypothetical protein AAT22_06930 [Clostridium sp. C8]